VGFGVYGRLARMMEHMSIKRLSKGWRKQRRLGATWRSDMVNTMTQKLGKALGSFVRQTLMEDFCLLHCCNPVRHTVFR
jgi:hypothetical protein